MNGAHRRAASTPLTVVALAAVAFAACSLDSIRRGALGDSCTRTDDCEAPLACRATVCVDVDAGAGTSSTGTIITGGQGGAGGGSPTTTTTTTTSGSGGATTTSSSTGSGGATTTTTTTTGTTGSGGATTTTSSSSTGSGGGGGGNGLDFDKCAACLDSLCASQEAACGPDCIALEACIETVCANLSAIASPDEGACQVHCQAKYPAAKAPHLAMVNCAASAPCAPCSSYPWDYEICIAKASGGACAATLDACNQSTDCGSYRDCLTTCATLKECLACDDGPGGPAGAALLLDYQACLAEECLGEAWLP